MSILDGILLIWKWLLILMGFGITAIVFYGCCRFIIKETKRWTRD